MLLKCFTNKQYTHEVRLHIKIRSRHLLMFFSWLQHSGQVKKRTNKQKHQQKKQTNNQTNNNNKKQNNKNKQTAKKRANV